MIAASQSMAAIGGAVAGAGAGRDEAAGEVVAVQERAVADEQGDACFERVEAGGAGPEGGGQVVSGHGGLRRARVAAAMSR